MSGLICEEPDDDPNYAEQLIEEREQEENPNLICDSCGEKASSSEFQEGDDCPECGDGILEFP